MRCASARRRTGEAQPLTRLTRRCGAGDSRSVPFHWEIEFPEVFDRENPGFDAFVGNPPFAGRTHVYRGSLRRVIHRLAQDDPRRVARQADLVAHFFRRAISAAPARTAPFGLIATNTIGQGDTRSAGCAGSASTGGPSTRPQSDVKWPGQAAVVVSVVARCKGSREIERDVSTAERVASINRLSASMQSRERRPEPLRRTPEQELSLGSKVLGMGFTFDDDDENSQTGSRSRIDAMKSYRQRPAERRDESSPYIGGEEVNDVADAMRTIDTSSISVR